MLRCKSADCLSTRAFVDSVRGFGLIPWEDLRFVLAVARCGNASAAARTLHVNASTVTRRIAALEEHLEVRLFDRHPSGMRVTPAGKAAVRAATRMEDEILAVDAEIRGLDRELRGSLRVTSTEVVFRTWRKDIATLHDRLPHVQLVLSTENRQVDLSRREADVALRLTASPPEHLVGRRYAEVFYAVYASQHLVARVTNGGNSLASYAEYPWIGWDEPFAQATDSIRDKYGPGAHTPLRVTAWGALLRCIEDGLGVSVLPCFVGDRLPNLVRLGPYFEGGFHFWALTHEPLRRAARVRVFMDFVAELMARDAPLFAGRAPAHKTVPVAPATG
ncbi:MAG: LysR family transcriptional regulator [Myxococcota bacterium]